MVYVFGNCELDTARVVLRRDGQAVRVEPQVFALLRYLIEHHGEVVRKEVLLDEIWSSRFVSESALTSRVKSARQAVGDDGSRQHVIRTVHGIGYELTVHVHVLEAAAIGGPIPDQPDTSPNDAAPPPSEASTAPGSRLPAAVQPLIGRAELLERLVEALAAHRLVTLAGPGGVGKTSVGFELARLVEHRYADGAHAVELVSVVDEGATLEAFATALDVNTRQQASVDDAIVDMLRPRQALLLIDNCEHVVEPLAALVNRVLRAAPGVSIVATSREPLAVAGEHVWTVEPLPFAAGETCDEEELAEVPAVALFVERARAVDPAFRLDATTARPWSRSAGASTASRWRSSWRPPGPAPSTWRRSPGVSTSASACCAASDAARTPGTGRSRTPSAGPTTCSPTPRNGCSRRWRCSPASSTWPPPSGSAGPVPRSGTPPMPRLPPMATATTCWTC